MTYLNYIQKYPIIGVSVLSTFVPVIVLLLKGKCSKPISVVRGYLLCKIAFDFAALSLASQGKNSLMICNAWTLLSYILTSLFFYRVFLIKEMKAKVLLLGIVFIFIFCVDMAYFNPKIHELYNHRYLSISPVIRSFFSIFLCLLFYYQLLKDMAVEDLSRSAVFWTVCAFLIYNAGTLFCSAINYSEFTWNSSRSMIVLMYMSYVFDTLMMGIISMGLILEKSK